VPACGTLRDTDTAGLVFVDAVIAAAASAALCRGP
jgi:hypothetical protein